MIMRLLLDQNLSPQTTLFLRGLGYDVIDIRELSLYGASDTKIIQKANQLNRIVLTFNSDFADVKEIPIGTYPGVIRLKIIPQTIEVLHPILKRELSFLIKQNIEGCLVIMDNRKVRIKRKV